MSVVKPRRKKSTSARLEKGRPTPKSPRKEKSPRIKPGKSNRHALAALEYATAELSEDDGDRSQAEELLARLEDCLAQGKDPLVIESLARALTGRSGSAEAVAVLGELTDLLEEQVDPLALDCLAKDLEKGTDPELVGALGDYLRAGMKPDQMGALAYLFPPQLLRRP